MPIIRRAKSMISGQGAKYIAAALNAYKKGERKHPTMRAIAASLSEQDMADLAAFYEQQGKASAQEAPKAAAEPPAAPVLPHVGPTGDGHAR